MRINMNPAHKITADDALHQLQDAVAQARTFFGIDAVYETPVWPDAVPENAPASVSIEPGYFFRPISVDVDFYMRNPHKIKGDMAHEVAHLMSDEMACTIQRLPPEYGDKDSLFGKFVTDALERLTVRLEHLYQREQLNQPLLKVDRPANVRQAQSCQTCAHWQSLVAVPGGREMGQCGVLKLGERQLHHHNNTGNADGALFTPPTFGCAYHEGRE